MSGTKLNRLKYIKNLIHNHFSSNRHQLMNLNWVNRGLENSLLENASCTLELIVLLISSWRAVETIMADISALF